MAKERDRRQLPKLLHINNYTDHLLESLDVPQLRVSQSVNQSVCGGLVVDPIDVTTGSLLIHHL